MYIERASFQDISVIRPVGKLTIGGGDVQLRSVIADALNAGKKEIVLDLVDVTTIDSSGIGELVGSYTTVSNRGGRLVTARMPTKLHDILQVTQLITVFDVFRSVDAAVDAVGISLPAPLRAGSVDTLDGIYFSSPRDDRRIVVPRIVDANEALAARLLKEPESIYELPSRRFEELVAELVKQFGWGAELTPATRDGGRDIIATIPSDVGVLLCLIEAKRYRADRKVGVELVRTLFGTVEHEQSNLGMLVTTSSFAKDAVEFQQSHRFRLSLKDNVDIFEWLRSYLRGRRR